MEPQAKQGGTAIAVPPVDEVIDQPKPTVHASDGRVLLFSSNDAMSLREQWSDIQAAFVDEPRKAVERADELVADVMNRLAQMFATERTGLEKQWDRGAEITTEELRVALQRYRSFFDRLLSL